MTIAHGLEWKGTQIGFVVFAIQTKYFQLFCKVKISLSFAGCFMATGSFGRDFARFSVNTTKEKGQFKNYDGPLLARSGYQG